MDLFRASIQTWPEVVACAALTGEMDYLLRVVVADMAHYSRFIMDTLLEHPARLQDQLRAGQGQSHDSRADIATGAPIFAHGMPQNVFLWITFLSLPAC
ncbi:DNA-binding Lrp family transcriptional regulator [Variovorax guangxiensis]|nr:DNA-binding Lrp family transcriptional regulator [Variovorax guangxiensis]